MIEMFRLLLLLSSVCLYCKAMAASNKPPAQLSKSTDPGFQVDASSVQSVNVLGIKFMVLKTYIQLASIEKPDKSAHLAGFVFPSAEAPVSLLRIKGVLKKTDYDLSSELTKTQLEWSDQNVVLLSDLKDVYKNRPLEKQKGLFEKGVGHLVSAKIKGNPNPFVLFTYVAESKDKSFFVSQLCPAKEFSEKTFEECSRAFKIVIGSMP